MIVSHKGIEARVPDFLIVGAAKSGTTSMYHYLRQHHQIFMPQRKEPHFFSSMDSSKDRVENYKTHGKTKKGKLRRYEDYVDLFEPAKREQIVGEASTSYLPGYERTIDNIKSVYRDRYEELKIIAILRHPAERAFSNYLFYVRNGWVTSSFEDIFNPKTIEKMTPNDSSYAIVQGGMYYKGVKNYLEQFPKTKIYLLEDLKEIRVMLKDLFDFLEVEASVEVRTDAQVNPSGIPKYKNFVRFLLRMSNPIKSQVPQKYWLTMGKIRDSMLKRAMYKPQLDPLMKLKLNEIYRSDVLSLQELLGRDLSHWMYDDT